MSQSENSYGYPSLSYNKELCLGIKTKHHILTKRILKNFSIHNYIEVATLPEWSIERKKYDWRGGWRRRLWHNSAENIAAGYEKNLHDKLYRALNHNTFRSHAAANEYFAIWHVKNTLFRTPLSDAILKGVSPDTKLDIKKLEVLESKEMAGIPGDRDGAVFRGIDQTIIFMHFRTMKLLEGMKGIKWRLVSAPDDSFVAPMTPPDRAIIPISHNMLLCGVSQSDKHRPEYIKDEHEIGDLNHELVKNEDQWVAARSKRRLEIVKNLAR